MTLEASVAAFKQDLRQLGPATVVDNYLLREECAGDIDFDQRELRERVSRRFSVPVESVYIVGSAKFGFSLHDKYMDTASPRPAYSPFSDESDIDIAIVDAGLFDDIWKMCFEFWERTFFGYSLARWDKAEDFRDYVFRGWMRPDMLPAAPTVTWSRLWFQFFQRLMSERAAGDNRITAALYREMYFFRKYQEFSVQRALAKLPEV